MLKIFSIEFIKTVFSLRFLICIFILGSIYITQCLPEKWIYYLEPMDELHFFYNTLKEDRKMGSTEKIEGYAYNNTLGQTQRVVVYEKHIFNEQEMQRIDEVLNELNKNVTDNINPAKVDIRINYSILENYLDEINITLGGDSYYSKDGRYNLYETYLYNTLGAVPISNANELNDKMYDYLQVSLQENCYLKFDLDFFQSEKHYTTEELDKAKDIYNEITDIYNNNMSSELKYDNILIRYDELDKSLGGNTVFGERYRNTYFNKRYSLTQAKQQYYSIVNQEKLTNAYARYYGDYMTVFAGILPAILGAFCLWFDQRHKMCEMIASKEVTSIKYFFFKFINIVSIFFTAFIIIAFISTILFSIFSKKYTIEMDYFAFFKYTLFWTMPTVCYTAASSMFFYLLFQNPIPSLGIETLIFFFSMKDLYGHYSILKPIIRYNMIGRYDFYIENYERIIRNRIFMFIVSMGFILLGSLVYEIKRRGIQPNYLLYKKKNA
jgi:hypothetical protein